MDYIIVIMCKTILPKMHKHGELVGGPARVGLVAPIDVVVPPGNTGLDPSQTSFFQVLNIPTKINKGSVEIVANVDLIKKGDKVGSSEAALLAKLGICPFSYGLVITGVYDDGSSLAVSYPTLATAPHMFLNAYKNVVAIGVEIDSFNVASSFPSAASMPIPNLNSSPPEDDVGANLGDQEPGGANLEDQEEPGTEHE
ncbi:hypothetical protein BRADI_5g15635v3 [Brachypodium distachyon]|uniref:Large ribosomal subunit protein uL10-like insertion domain-containing protein n=1 Tax=Brachypodium distachyon TaxID=15368 RepID=A0A0Q3P460_BRADI|nr:hypothetical protein BRADI_5g15635v3 [Brachypodium distachyon]